MLRAQGWEPGQFLGAKDAAHADLHTAASASHIRVSVKDDLKGLGWSKSKEDGVTGLDVFSDLLSRLNGKSAAAVESEQQARLVLKMNRYVEQKYGPMRFVRGGFLVGDVIEEAVGEESDKPTGTPKKEKKTKKRKVNEVEMGDDAEVDPKAEKRRRREEKKAKKAAAESAPRDGAEENKQRYDKKRTISKKNKSIPGTDEDKPGKKSRRSKSESKTPSVDSEADEPKKSKVSKKDKKEKKEKKERGKKAEKEEEKEEEEEKSQRTGSAQESSEQDSAASSAIPTGTSTPSERTTGASTPSGLRNFARSRFIAAKRQAMLDTKALNQVCSREFWRLARSRADEAADLHGQDIDALCY